MATFHGLGSAYAYIHCLHKNQVQNTITITDEPQSSKFHEAHDNGVWCTCTFYSRIWAHTQALLSFVAQEKQRSLVKLITRVM